MEDISVYAHSPAHYAIARGDHAELRRIVAGLPPLAKAGEVNTEAESLAAELQAEEVSAVIDCRNVPGRETPLHLAVKLNDPVAAEILMAAGADSTLRNIHGWNALQEAVYSKEDAIAMIIVRHSKPLAWAKWCRRLPRILASAARIQDFYMEMTFRFESSVIPFIGRIAPSDTYRIWKRGSNLRADMTLAGFDGYHIQRSDKTVMFLGDGYTSDDGNKTLPRGSLIVLAHKKKEITKLVGTVTQPSEAAVASEVASMSKSNLYRSGIHVSEAELVPCLNWRRQSRTEMIGSWKAKVYDMLNVTIKFTSRRVPGTMTDEELFSVDDEEQFANGDNEDGYDNLLTEEERIQLDSAVKTENSESEDVFEDVVCSGDDDLENDSDTNRMTKEKKSLSAHKSNSKNRIDNKENAKKVKDKSKSKTMNKKKGTVDKSKHESEYKKGLRPVLWLTRDFPLKTDELLPLLDILANKVKAVRRLRELLATKLPPGTFPVQVAIPVVPTVRVLVTFNKFEELRPAEEFSTPMSSPTHFPDSKSKESEGFSSSWIHWMRGSRCRQSSQQCKDDVDPFHIPSDYTWVDANAKKRRMKGKRAGTKKREKPAAPKSGEKVIQVNEHRE